MKRHFLLLLTYGIHASSFAQPEISKADMIKIDNWVLSANNNLKGNNGRLILNFPPGTRWELYSYKMADREYVNSFSEKTKLTSAAMVPGAYMITLNNAPIQNVQVKKGHDTKLKTGILHITEDSVWYLYDEAG